MCTTREEAIKKWNEKEEKSVMGNEAGIVYINITQIYPHPENPRKNLGDLTELSESLKKNGVMQNLTVIPGHYLSDEEWRELTKQYKETPSEEARESLNSGWKPDGYTLIIGHRRHAAACLAGITELPCKIVNGMDRKEQLSVMLEENMQRNDLTILEQAQGFQLMLDLGETEDTIAQKTGFSKTTIRHRLNIAKLDSDLVKEKEKDDYFQLSLKDLYALEKVSDVKKRNEILKNASDSRNLMWRAQQAADEERRAKVADAIIAGLKELGIEKAPKKAENEQYSGKWDKVKKFDLDKPAPGKISVRGKTEEMYYLNHYNMIWVIRKTKQKEKQMSPQEQEHIEINRKKKEMKAKQKALTASVSDFIHAIIEGKVDPVKTDLELLECIWRALIDNSSYASRDKIISFVAGKHLYELNSEEEEKVKQKISDMPVIHQMLAMIPGSIDRDLINYSGKFDQENGRRCTALIQPLERWGFFITEEQQQMLNGTHELYVKEKEGDAD